MCNPSNHILVLTKHRYQKLVVVSFQNQSGEMLRVVYTSFPTILCTTTHLAEVMFTFSCDRLMDQILTADTREYFLNLSEEHLFTLTGVSHSLIPQLTVGLIFGDMFGNISGWLISHDFTFLCWCFLIICTYIRINNSNK